MCRSEKKRRKAFLNEMCESFGIASTDPRRSDAAVAFIAYGENVCREWLAQAGGNFARWEAVVDIKQAKRKVSMLHRTRTSWRKKVLIKYTPKIRKKRSRNTRQKVRDHSFRGTICADGSGTGWRNLSRSEEYRLANRI